MDEHTARKFAYLLVEQARVFGMAAENEACKARDEPPSRNEDDFFAAAGRIDEIARSI